MRWMRNVRAAVAALVLAAVLAPSQLRAVEAARWSGAASHTDAEDGLPLWRVTDGERSLYLLGSIHLLRPSAYPLHPAIYRAFDAARVVAFELSPEEIAAAGPVMMELSQLPPGRTLRTELPADLVDELERRIGELGLPAAAFHGVKPWVVALSLSALVLQRAGFSAETGIEMHFMARGREAGKRMVGLETAREQFSIFDSLDRAGQVAFVRYTLEDLDESAARLDETTAMWQRGDAEAIADELTEALRTQPALAAALLDDRNRAWIPDIEALLAAGEPAMVIVGMGHLVGRGSVVELLRERGYSVERVTCPADTLLCAA